MDKLSSTSLGSSATESASLSLLIQQVKTALAHSESINISAYESIEKVIALLREPSKSDQTGCTKLTACTTDVEIFRSTYYASFLNLLISNYSSDWLQPDGQGRILDDLFAEAFSRGPPEEVLISVVIELKSQRGAVAEYKTHRLLSLLKSLLRQHDFLQRIIKEKCGETRSEDETLDGATVSRDRSTVVARWQIILSTIASLPDVTTSRLDVNSSSLEFFFPQKYIPFVCDNICSALRYVYTELRSGCSASVRFISAIIGKLSATGYAELTWSCLLKDFTRMCSNDFLYKRIIQRVVADIPDQWIESVIVQLVVSVNSPLLLIDILNTSVVDNPKIAYLFTHKLLLVRHYGDTRVLANIFGYLTGLLAAHQLFVKAFQAVLKAWADGSSLRHRPQEQSLYLCQAIMICTGYMRKDKSLSDDVGDIVRHCLINGLANYLDSAEPSIRQMGCVVAEQLSGFIPHQDGQDASLRFGLEDNDLIKDLRNLINISDDHYRSDSKASSTEADRNETEGKDKEKKDNRLKSNETGSVSSTTNKVTDGPDIKDKASKPLDSDDDDDDVLVDDDLKRFPSDPSYVDVNNKRPRYLAQCLEGLLNADDAELVELCLMETEVLFKSSCAAQGREARARGGRGGVGGGDEGREEMAVEFVKVLLHMEDRFALPSYSKLRHKALVAAVISSPNSTALYLSNEFYARNYNVAQRMDMLDVLSSTARELSAVTSGAGVCAVGEGHKGGEGESERQDVTQSTHVTKDASASIIRTSFPSSASDDTTKPAWQRIIDERIRSKTRRFVHGPTRPPPITSVNKFSSVAGSFFYPIINKFGEIGGREYLDLVGADHLLLQRLLHTLGVIIYAASNTPDCPRMTQALLEFIWMFRRHPRTAVRQSVLYSVYMSLVSLPPSLLITLLNSEHLVELKDWLEGEVLLNDTDRDCRQLAAYILNTLHTSLRQELE